MRHSRDLFVIGRVILSVVATLVVLGTASGEAADSLTPGQFHVDRATLHSLGFRWIVGGDDNRNAVARVRFRRLGETDWDEGPEMLRIHGEPAGTDGFVCGNLFAGSLVDLESGTTYEVRVSLTDSDGIFGVEEQRLEMTTRSPPTWDISGATLHVYTSCAGDVLSPCFNDIELAARSAQPGDLVLIHEGTYFEPNGLDLRFLSDRATSASQPIVFRGVSRDAVVIDGGVLPDAQNRTPFIRVEGTRHLHFERLRVSHAATAFEADNAVGLVLRGLKIDQVSGGVRSEEQPTALDRDWYVVDNEIIGWNPLWYPYSTRENRFSHTGIMFYGTGHVVERNSVGKFWDCIAHANTGAGLVTNETVDWQNPPARSNDVAYNELFECYDDGIEADYGFHNLRVISNRITNAHTALSAQPLYCGPVYFVRNTAFNIASNSFKFHNQPSGIEAYHNTFGVHDFALECQAGWINGRLLNNLMLGDPQTSTWSVLTGTVSHPRSVIDYNGYTPTLGLTMFRWSREPFGAEIWRDYPDLPAFFDGEGYEQHGIEVDYTIFENAWFPAGEGTTSAPDDVDLRLHDGVGAVDTGVPIAGFNDGFTGVAPDLGAHELGSVVPAYGPRPGAIVQPGEPGDAAGGRTPLTIRKQSGEFLLAWSAPAAGGPVYSYKLYRSPLAESVSFDPSCEANLGADTSASVGELADDHGFVVVASNDAGEGSYGRTSAGSERRRAYGAAECP
ncbi:MAG: right-handed parallel beta-helix repeat-containing protein [Acidobacteriota bacterium]|nr:MAG: right-handed parallel beta-helix repeat-containing protein [Acidobacteriota bacterium]